MGKSLAKIVEDHRSLDEILIEAGGDISAEDQEKIVTAWIEEIKSDLANKADGYEYRSRMLEQANEAISARVRMLQTAAQTCKMMGAALKGRFKEAMLEMNTDEIIGNDFKFKISKSGPSVSIDSIAELPAKYSREKISIEIDKESIREDLSSGVSVPGASLTYGYRLTVSANKKIKELK